MFPQALEKMNGKTINGNTLYVSRAQKKKERQQELMRRHEAEKMERYNRLVVVSGCTTPPISPCWSGIKV